MTKNHAIAALTVFAVAAPAAIGLGRLGAVVLAPTAPEVEVVESSALGRLEPAPPAPAAIAPVITFIDEPTAEQREMVDWAVARYLSIGLQLPDVDIDFPTTCGGKAGRYHVGQGKIELCHPNRKLVLHELAHAWDDGTNVVDRDAFLEMRGVDHWYEHPDADGEHVSGGEQLAHVVTWGLMHIDITAPRSEYPGQPRDEQPRYLPGLADSSPETLTNLFVMLTGSDPLSPGRFVDAAASRAGEPYDKRPEAGGPRADAYLPDTSGAVYNHSGRMFVELRECVDVLKGEEAAGIPSEHRRSNESELPNHTQLIELGVGRWRGGSIRGRPRRTRRPVEPGSPPRPRQWSVPPS